MAQTFFYDEQVRRFLLQFIRVFSNFQVEYGKDRAGNTTLLTVPVKYGDATRMVSSIIRENSENKVVPTPMLSCYVAAMEYQPERRQDPAFIDKQHIRMRKYDHNTGEYLTTQGNAYTVERMMPVPYQLTLNVDIWTSNTTQKLQLLEQLLVLFNPALEIQSTDNYLDWTSLSYIELTQTQWSSRAVPVGVDDAIDIATLTFTVPIWLTAPSKVKKLGVVQKIVASIYDESGSISDGVIDNDILLGERMKFTPMNFGILLIGNQVTILHREETTTNKVDYDPLNDPPTKIPASAEETTWKALINQYGALQAGISQLRLEIGTGEIIGTVAHHPSDDYKLLFTINEDTKPTNTITSVLKIINPLNNAPGAGLSASSAGQRYLILNAIGDSSNTDGADAWKSTANVDFVAGANDIIEYDGTKWEVKFDSSSESGVQYTTNITSGIQYKWNGSSWVKSYEGEYRAGDWSLVI
jgi:hypothetical protein